jgi:hypothetical protein
MLRYNKKAFKAFVFSLILSTFSSIVPAIGPVYQIAPGPLAIGDVYAFNPVSGQVVVTRGQIMHTLLTNPSLSRELRQVCAYAGVNNPANLPPYQLIVESLKNSTDNRVAVEVIEAFEETIMKIVHYENYILLFTEGKWSNMWLAGIRKTWFSPSDWINLSTWLPYYVSADVSQLMAEIKQLAQIASRHSLALSFRLNNKADSYLYWKARTLKTLAALGAVGAIAYNRENIAKGFDYAGDLARSGYSAGANLVGTASQAAADLGNTAYNAGAYLGNTAYDAGAYLGNTTYDAGAYLGNATYDAGAYLGNAASGIGSSAYQTVTDLPDSISRAGSSIASYATDWRDYLGSFMPSQADS